MTPKTIQKLKQSIKVVRTTRHTIKYRLGDTEQMAEIEINGLGLPWDAQSRVERRDWVEDQHQDVPSERAYLEADLLLYDALEAARTSKT